MQRRNISQQEGILFHGLCICSALAQFQGCSANIPNPVLRTATPEQCDMLRLQSYQTSKPYHITLQDVVWVLWTFHRLAVNSDGYQSLPRTSMPYLPEAMPSTHHSPPLRIILLSPPAMIFRIQQHRTMPSCLLQLKLAQHLGYQVLFFPEESQASYTKVSIAYQFCIVRALEILIEACNEILIPAQYILLYLCIEERMGREGEEQEEGKKDWGGEGREGEKGKEAMH